MRIRRRRPYVEHMRHAPWSISVTAVAVGTLVVVGGTPVGNAGLDAAAPAIATLVGAASLAVVLLRRRAWRSLPAPVRTTPQPRRMGGPRVF